MTLSIFFCKNANFEQAFHFCNHIFNVFNIHSLTKLQISNIVDELLDEKNQEHAFIVCQYVVFDVILIVILDKDFVESLVILSKSFIRSLSCIHDSIDAFVVDKNRFFLTKYLAQIICLNVFLSFSMTFFLLLINV